MPPVDLEIATKADEILIGLVFVNVGVTSVCSLSDVNGEGRPNARLGCIVYGARRGGKGARTSAKIERFKNGAENAEESFCSTSGW